MSDIVHIVCLDAPSPPDYGGVFDLYYKIPALSKKGQKVILHYFDYKVQRSANGLEKYCLEIFRYKRTGFIKFLISRKPFIVSSRINSDLIRRLNSDDHPILLEGIHCTGIIPYINNKKRIVIRVHNDEAKYYNNLNKSEKAFLKKLYFFWETALLRRYQKELDPNLEYSCVALTDIEVFQKKYGFKNLSFVPCFLPWQQISSDKGKGNYCLYQGNISVPENVKAAEWLITEVFSNVKYRLIIAGKDASRALKKKVEQYPNINLVENPSDSQLQELIRNAHINVLPSMNQTGVKLKLLHALFSGRFCITNDAGIQGSDIKQGVHIANSPDEYIKLITHLMDQPFTENEIKERNSLLQTYNNDQNAQRLKTLLLKHYQ